jgi:hypothetical protein
MISKQNVRIQRQFLSRILKLIYRKLAAREAGARQLHRAYDHHLPQRTPVFDRLARNIGREGEGFFNVPSIR